MELKLIDNANGRAEALIFSNNVQDSYKSLVDSIKQVRSSKFAIDMQNLTTKVALIIDEIVEEPKKTTPDTFLGGINYICHTILSDKALHAALLATDVNNGGNDQKHSLKEANVNIRSTVEVYNRMVNAVVCALGLEAMKLLLVDFGSYFATSAPEEVAEVKVEAKPTEEKKPEENKTEYEESCAEVICPEVQEAEDEFAEEAEEVDGEHKLTARIENTQGLFEKRGFISLGGEYIGFDIVLEYEGRGRIKAAVAHISSSRGYVTHKLKGGRTHFELPTGK